MPLDRGVLRFGIRPFRHTSIPNFSDHANSDITFERPKNPLFLDNASWHRGKDISWGRFQPVFLPPYSPDLNPIERL
ncbi:MAG: transposase [Desulfomonilaceae bacterium]